MLTNSRRCVVLAAPPLFTLLLTHPHLYLQMRKALLEWYDANHRILPWRRNPHSKLSADAVAAAAAEGSHPAPADLPLDTFIYYVWVCEIMSQQTQVSRAAAYFRKWVAKWPDVSSLAAATQEEVNEVWAGLGYYRRAKYLLDGAKYIVEKRNGKFPRTAKELQAIPGVGAYTSCAIASIACGEKAAVVDGNVVRVMARLRRLGGDPKSAAMVKLFADVAGQALDPERPGDFNQAVMELGATVCVPNTTPACGSCPVAQWCEARKAAASGGAPVTDYPTKVEKAEKREESVAVAVLRVMPGGGAPSRFLLVKRPPGGLLAGLWEFPLAPVAGGASADARRGAIDDLLNGVLGEGFGGLKIAKRKDLGDVVHVFSHIRMTMHVESITLQGEVPEALTGGGGDDEDAPPETKWLSEDELQAAGLTSGVKKVYKLYTQQREKGKSSIQRFFKPKGGA